MRKGGGFTVDEARTEERVARGESAGGRKSARGGRKESFALPFFYFSPWDSRLGLCSYTTHP